MKYGAVIELVTERFDTVKLPTVSVPVMLESPVTVKSPFTVVLPAESAPVNAPVVSTMSEFT